MTVTYRIDPHMIPIADHSSETLQKLELFIKPTCELPQQNYYSAKENYWKSKHSLLANCYHVRAR